MRVQAAHHPAVGREPSPLAAAARRLAADGAVIATFAAVIVVFAVSPVTLEAYGIEYIDADSGLLAKIHPATLIAIAALGLRLVSLRRPVRDGFRLLTDDAGATLLMAAVLIAMIVAAFAARTPVTPLLDTFVLPVIFFLLLRDLDGQLLKWLAYILVAILTVNGILALLEFLRGFHLMRMEAPPGTSFDPTRADAVFDWRSALSSDWRATALFGHPLSNGLVTGCAILCLVAPGSRWLPLPVRSLLPLLLLVSMFAFGARTALVLTLALTAFVAGGEIVAAIGRGARLKPHHLAIALVLIGSLVAASLVLLQMGFFDRTLERFVQDDGSASTRITMFDLFDPISLSDMFLGPDKDLVATSQRVYGLEFGIESSWVGLVLIYGLIVTTIIVFGLFAFMRSVVRICGGGAIVVFLLNLILISVAASLSGKTITFAMTVILILVFLRKDERHRPSRTAADVGLVC